MTHRIFGAPTLFITVLLVMSIRIGHGYAQQEPFDVKMTHPPEGGKVGKEVMVQGTAAIPNGHYLWVLARRIDFAPLWWPQRPAPLEEPTTQKQKWQATAVFGGPQDVGWDFHIQVITVNEEGHKQLMEYWKTAMRTGDWRPIEIPPVTSPPRIVRVKKVSH